MNNAGGVDDGAPQGAEVPSWRRRRARFRRHLTDEERVARHRRIRRRGRRAYIRSVYSLPSLATLGNAICGFASIYVTFMDPRGSSNDAWTNFFIQHHFWAACYLLFIAMLFDALDGRLARFARHTTDFGGQLDSLADVVSFGAAPAFLMLQMLHESKGATVEPVVSRTIWAIGALYLSCATIRLARFNVSNEHGEQHHFSFLGLPSPGAAAVVAGYALMLLDLSEHPWWQGTADAMMWGLPLVVLGTGLLMVSAIRYPHLVNRYLRGRRSIGRLLLALVLFLLLVVAHRYTIGIGTLAYALWGPLSWLMARMRRRGPAVPATTPGAAPRG
jgi:CDP-diacylglycerol--serine O-phosphatidyltransferase